MVLLVMLKPNLRQLGKHKTMESSDKRHYAVVDDYKRKLTITYQGEVIAETTDALILKEVATTVYNPVFYLPKESLKIDAVE